jgi:S1-C subfamily serine protease
VVARVAPAIVDVAVAKTARPDFGGAPFGRGLAPFVPPEVRERGEGSGVIVTADGYVLTNNHVVDGADEVRVTLADGRHFPARTVGRDPKTDIAVLEIHATGLPVAHFGDSSKVRAGQWARPSAQASEVSAGRGREWAMRWDGPRCAA